MFPIDENSDDFSVSVQLPMDDDENEEQQHEEQPE